MKKLFYTVKGLSNEEAGERALKALRAALPQSENAEYSVEESRLSFSVKGRISHDEIEQRLSGALAALDLELILPEGVESYTYVGKRQKKIKTIPVAVCASIVAACMALTMLFTFTACDVFGAGNNAIGNVIQQAPAQQQNTTITIDGANLPDYIEELVKLDAIFKANSYDGVDEETMKTNILKAYIAATGDLYAEYMTKAEYESYNQSSRGDFVGVGISIVNTTVVINGFSYKVLNVTSVYKNSPAIENGVKAGDLIAYVGVGDDKVLVSEIGYDAALERLLGEEGTEAKFTVLRPDENEVSGYKEIEFSIVRRKVITETVTYRVSETDSKVGIVHISGFDMPTATQFKAAVNELLMQGCEYFVFDMRNNGGGSLYSIEAVLSYFLNSGDMIIATEYADGSKYEDYVKPVNYGSQYEGYNVKASEIAMYKALKGKSVVLTNAYTASAAELFTATMRDYGFAKIVGDTTYGKGCMQNTFDLSKYGMEGALKVTVAMYFSKSRTVYHGIGIKPDYEIALSDEAKEYNFFLLPEEKDNQLQKAIDVLLGN